MKVTGRKRRHNRVRRTVIGISGKPRLTVFRSNKHIYAQIVDDSADKVITGVSTLSPMFKDKKIKTTDKAAAEQIGLEIAKKAKAAGFTKVCFDRAGYKYHGRIKALADGAREGGLEF
ncbi:MAG: 50S ribosomal protein L18 [Candidatus Omnitrophica bacterium]|nr:50S ribosomal protein L18 [Candidatus Omnitrophota bacterium]MDD5080751.1 50S ribosomal protein L18 [Candidatus Omnitrophota bacterium]MDD5441263.1 50S ribosomal protein L18 [Candidatus Omnitrophota bacterium]